MGWWRLLRLGGGDEEGVEERLPEPKKEEVVVALCSDEHGEKAPYELAMLLPWRSLFPYDDAPP